MPGGTVTHQHKQPRTASQRVVRGWRTRSVDDRWDVYQYVVSAFWAVGFVIFTPAALQPILTMWTTIVPMGVIVAGAGVAIVGRIRNDHLRIELWGALAIVAGFGFYLLLNLLLVFLATPERIVQTLLVLLAMAFAVKRLRVLAPRLMDVIRSDR